MVFFIIFYLYFSFGASDFCLIFSRLARTMVSERRAYCIRKSNSSEKLILSILEPSYIDTDFRYKLVDTYIAVTKYYQSFDWCHRDWYHFRKYILCIRMSDWYGGNIWDSCIYFWISLSLVILSCYFISREKIPIF